MFQKIYKRMALRQWARQQDDKSVRRLIKEDDLLEHVVESTEGHGGLFSDLISWIKSDPKGFLEFVMAIIAMFPK